MQLETIHKQSNLNMDFSIPPRFLNPITNSTRNALAVVRQPMADAITGTFSTAGQINGEMNQFGERVGQDFTRIGNVVTSFGDYVSMSVEEDISAIHAIGKNPELLPQTGVQLGEAIGENPELLTHMVPVPFEV